MALCYHNFGLEQGVSTAWMIDADDQRCCYPAWCACDSRNPSGISAKCGRL